MRTAIDTNVISIIWSGDPPAAEVAISLGGRQRKAPCHFWINGRPGVEFVLQTEQLGTGHAVMTCRELLAQRDGPVGRYRRRAAYATRLRGRAVGRLRRRPAACVFGTACKDDPGGLGRILRDAGGNFVGIIEHRDATPEQRRITEINMSYYVFDGRQLLGVLDEIRPNNRQGEYYITDAPGLLAAQGKEVRALPVLKPCEALGINTVEELAVVEPSCGE